MKKVWTTAGAICLLLFVGCSGTKDTVGQDVRDVTEVTAEVKPTEVVLLPDVPRVEEVLDLVGDNDAADTVDVPQLQCAPGEGCFLDQCTENADCQAGWCVLHMGESVCSQTCQEECPAGWTCRQVAGTDPDVVYICVSDYANLCRPCTTNADCTSTGGAEDACLDYGPDGNFCGGACGEDETCPWGFSCGEAVGVGGAVLSQCLNDTGVCPCTDSAVALGLTTPCSVTNDFGTCTGLRTCSEDGLTGCDAAVPAAEVCDGLDNDCDDETDEPDLVDGDYVNLCDDGNPCTEDKCTGEEGCTNEVLDEGSCDDGDPCTVADHCVAGTCLGDPVECDDDNPCTDNICTANGGCEYPPNGVPCDDENPCTLADTCVEGACVGTPANCDCLADEDCAALEDGDLCNGTLVCNTEAVPYQCVVAPETVVVCPEPEGENAFCLQSACDPGTGECSFTPAHEGFLCDSGDACTVNDHCVEGICTGGVAVNCNDGNPCTDDSCDAVEGCVHATLGNGTPCLGIPGYQCMNGQCICIGGCQGLECGPDPCGNSCGECGEDKGCVEGVCVQLCVADCEGKTCGDDGCGGSCGECEPGIECTNGACEKAPKPNWGVSFGAAQEPSVAVALDGVVVSGDYFGGQTSIGGDELPSFGDRDVFVAKFNKQGQYLWSVGFGGVGQDEEKAVAVDAAGFVYVTGFFNSPVIPLEGAPLVNAGGDCAGSPCHDVFLVKLAPTGSLVWAKRFGLSGIETVSSVSLNATGKVLLAGTFSGDSTHLGGGALQNKSPGSSDAFLAQMTASGEHAWSASLGGAGSDGVAAACASGEEWVVVGYYTSSQLILDGVTGPLANEGGADGFVASYDHLGNAKWARSLGGDSHDHLYTVSAAADGDIFVGGSTQSAAFQFAGGDHVNEGLVGMLLASYEEDGTPQWANVYGGPGFQAAALSSATDGQGGVYFSGYYLGPGLDFGGGALPCFGAEWHDVFVAKFTGQGQHTWSLGLGGPSQDMSHSNSLASDGQTGLVLTGYYYSDSIQIGASTLDKVGSEYDVFLVSFPAQPVN